MRDENKDKDGGLRCTGRDRTGCMFCMYGAHLDNRFEKMKCTHPGLYDYIMNRLGGRAVLEKYIDCSRESHLENKNRVEKKMG